MNLLILYFLFTVSLIGQHAHGGRILGIFHVPSRSHHILGSALLKALAQRGHQVTMVSPYPFKKEVENYRDVFLEEMLQYKQDSVQHMMTHNTSRWNSIHMGRKMFYDTCDILLSHEKIHKLKQEKFDLVIQFAISTESLLGLGHHFGAPTILFSTIGSNAVVNSVVGNPAPLSYIPQGGLSIPSDMNFLQRTLNTLSYLGMAVVFVFLRNQQEELYQKHFPDGPPLQELLHNVSLILVNSHWSIESPRPYVPNMVQIGGFHIEQPKELPADLKAFLDKASEGAVFFSLGSNVQLSSLPENVLDAIFKTLGKLKMKVLLKSEQNFTGLPDNIRVGKWLPQNDILGHPNVKLFITHGGLLSTTEAVYHGVPILGIPFFGDQQFNIADAVQAGYALRLDVNDITEESLSKAIEEILNNSKYRQIIKLKSSLLKGQHVKPMDLAVFWVEHVLKHKGASHLKNAGVNLKWYQYYLLDVFLFMFTIATVVILVIYNLLKFVLRKAKKLLTRPKVKIN